MERQRRGRLLQEAGDVGQHCLRCRRLRSPSRRSPTARSARRSGSTRRARCGRRKLERYASWKFAPAVSPGCSRPTGSRASSRPSGLTAPNIVSIEAFTSAVDWPEVSWPNAKYRQSIWSNRSLMTLKRSETAAVVASVMYGPAGASPSTVRTIAALTGCDGSNDGSSSRSREVLLEDRDEPAVVRARHVATGTALALLDDADERGLPAARSVTGHERGPGQR